MPTTRSLSYLVRSTTGGVGSRRDLVRHLSLDYASKGRLQTKRAAWLAVVVDGSKEVVVRMCCCLNFGHFRLRHAKDGANPVGIHLQMATRFVGVRPQGRRPDIRQVRLE
jgi:hypothetical protein